MAVPTSFSGTTIAAAVNFTIGDNPDLGDFKVTFPNAESLSVSMFPNYNKYYIALDAYRILVGRFPDLKPHIIYTALMQECGLRRRISTDWKAVRGLAECRPFLRHRSSGDMRAHGEGGLLLVCPPHQR